MQGSNASWPVGGATRQSGGNWVGRFEKPEDWSIWASMYSSNLELGQLITVGDSILKWTATGVKFVDAAFAMQADFDSFCSKIGTPIATGSTAMVAGVQYTYGAAGWASGAIQLLTPSGNDQTAEIQQFLNDTRNNASAIQFGVGDFVLNGQILIYSGKVNPQENSMGYGHSVFGSGPEYTRFLDVRSDKSSPCMLITQPSGIDVGRRYEMSRIGGFSLLACDVHGTPLALDQAAQGVGIMAKATTGSGFGAFVYHSNQMERIRFSGHAFPLTLDDTTQFFGRELRFSKADVAIRLGGNTDIIRLRDCGFGSESGIGRNDRMICVKTGYDFGIVPAGGANIIDIDGAWFMAIGTAIDDAGGSTQVTIRNSYFERCRRYYYANTLGDADCDISIEKCAMSFLDDQRGIVSTDPASADYASHIQIGATGISQSVQGPSAAISIRDCTGYVETSAYQNALITLNRITPGSIMWENNAIPASASFGHVRNTKKDYQMWRTIKRPLSNARVSIRLGGQNGCARTSGDQLEHSFTASAGTNNIFSYIGDKQFITLPDADCTLVSPSWSGTAPNYALTHGEEMTLHIMVPATVTGTRTVSFSNMRGLSSLQYTSADSGKACIVELRAIQAYSNVMQVMNSPAFYAV